MIGRSSRRDDDGGAIAVIAALTVTLLLIPIAAMAADLGAVYVREGDLQQVADVAARAGADELARRQRDDPAPSTVMAAARSTAVQALCAGIDTTASVWADVCTTTTWASDNDPANGEVSFYFGAPDTDGRYHADRVVPTAPDPRTWITGIRVVTPPLRVEFGLAAAFTADHTDLQTAATFGIFTVLPSQGFFPMHLALGEYGRFCSRGAPKARWGTNQLACASPAGQAIARGYLTADRTDPAENLKATTYNAANGFDAAHQPLPMPAPQPAATLKQNYYYSSYSWAEARLGDLTAGTLGTDGSPTARLRKGTCRGGYNASTSRFSGLESARLADFLDPHVGDKETFRTAATSPNATPADKRGWLSPEVLRCGRLAAVPILSGITNPPPDNGTAFPGAGAYSVLGVRLIWIDDRLWDTDDAPAATGNCYSRGFYWEDSTYSGLCQNDLRVYTGYILDPRLLPAIVTGKDAANALPSFIGSGMPATVRMLRDVSDPPAR
jgi:hypothetical protein